MASTFFFSDSPFTVTSTDVVITSVSYNNRFSTLTSAQLGNEVTSIDPTAFSGCTSLTSVTIGNSVTSIGGSAFYNCSALTSVTIPNSVTSIGNSAFAFCTNLATVVINGNSLTIIDAGAFYGPNSLKEITIPNSLTVLGISAFRDNANLIRVNFLGNAPTWGGDVFLNTNVNLKVYRYSTKSGWSSTFGGEDVLLIDSPATGLETFGFVSNSSGQASVKKTNVGSGRLTLSKFNPTNISNIESWTSQGGLSVVFNYNIAYVSYFSSYSAGDIDTSYYADDNTYTSYTGDEFGFTIIYSEGQGVWFLIDPNTEADIAYAEDLLAGVWFTYGGDLEYFELNDYEYFSDSSTDLRKSTWSDISGKNNDLITRFNPANGGIGQDTLNNLSRKQIGTPFRTNSSINFINPFTIYIALSDSYLGTNTRKIFGMNSFQNVGPSGYSQLYLESTSSGTNHIFTLKFYSPALGFIATICSLTVNKSIFASNTFGPSILKLSSDYTTTSASFSRTMTLTYYNRYSDANKTLGSLSASGSISLSTLSSDQWLYLGNDSFGYDGISPYWLYLSEFIMYSKFLNSTEDGAINRYLQRKYYGKLLS